ncbi:MAG: uroporphyrinogen-III C-methyltransferase [Hyphomonadaceae bacterium]|nr:uroporphyrinogen-III C-methyltransferase [Hyphomonadaceae bacterium]
MTGTVYLVGAGPGAADLLTVRAARLLAEADVVLHDALVSDDVLALAPKARFYNVGKRAHRPSVDQRLICRLLVRMGLRHRVVVRLKGGDPHLFARAAEEIDACQASGIAVVTVPGVSAAFAAASALGVSLTERGVSRSVAFVTPRVARNEHAEDRWADAAAAAETAVIYMGALHAERIVEGLAARGVARTTPIALVESASATSENKLRGVLRDLPALAATLGDGPSILIVGAIAAEARVGVREHRAA